MADRDRNTDQKPSRMRDLWESVTKDYEDTASADLSYIDRLSDDHSIRDEFVRLPYDTPQPVEECRW
jgi:hypothetical protein